MSPSRSKQFLCPVGDIDGVGTEVGDSERAFSVMGFGGCEGSV